MYKVSKTYIDKNKISGIDLQDQTFKEDIYDHYMQAYKKGVYNYMREEFDSASQEIIPRKYFSGGFRDADMSISSTNDRSTIEKSITGENLTL